MHNSTFIYLATIKYRKLQPYVLIQCWCGWINVKSVLVIHRFRGSWCIDETVPDCGSTKESQKKFVKLIGDNWKRYLDVFDKNLCCWSDMAVCACRHWNIVRKETLKVHLYQEDYKSQNLKASFTIRMLVRGNDHQPLTASSVTSTWPFPCLLYITNFQVWSYYVIFIYKLHLVV